MANNQPVPYLYCPARNTPNDQEACRECRFHDADAALTTSSGRVLRFVVCAQHGDVQATPVLEPEHGPLERDDAPATTLDLPCRVRDLDAGGHLGGRAVELRGHRLTLDCAEDQDVSPGAHVQLRIVLPRHEAGCPAEWVFGGRVVRVLPGPEYRRRHVEVLLRNGSAAFVTALADRNRRLTSLPSGKLAV